MSWFDIVLFGLVGFATIGMFYGLNGSYLIAVTTLGLAIYQGRVSGLGLLIIAVGVGLGWFFSNSRVKLLPKSLGHLLLIVLVLALSMHVVPGFENLKVVDGLRLAPDSLPYTMYLNLDKQFAAWILILVVGLKANRESLVKGLSRGIFFAIPVFLFIAALSLLVSWVRFNPKYPEILPIWAYKNLLFTCVSEELFFRAYIQTSLISFFSCRLKNGQYWGIAMAAVIFGLAHFAGGLTYVFMATVAGGVYGLAYYRSQSLEAAILTHFLVNLGHILLFSYPALAPS
ncbi:CPBP family intramembrane glutamic endopeptidase [Pseudobacteriovorax antillogorgiicola]|uniref:CAAX prenyl protease 2/Lysostaphin resistance protein A-like domain-containing protein n=1 Tax=Pseudobacteriovorax antillogorgiicola TaxID=1513793 RepID=A0A1Y6CX17_9BACT|nr:type II CAAX endopeptidase family protein [Pseudobacteriovorax antillogorgiicola]TCS40835.1 hypothetical protein EDD56_1542 [Pseudobacteriovorax antillogorgiicola]SMF84512.1 hypothetical protein SAMN06296036_1563 [Pseudobacteriovorax antillogorgiicola]